MFWFGDIRLWETMLLDEAETKYFDHPLTWLMFHLSRTWPLILTRSQVIPLLSFVTLQTRVDRRMREIFTTLKMQNLLITNLWLHTAMNIKEFSNFSQVVNGNNLGSTDELWQCCWLQNSPHRMLDVGANRVSLDLGQYRWLLQLGSMYNVLYKTCEIVNIQC